MSWQLTLMDLRCHRHHDYSLFQVRFQYYSAAFSTQKLSLGSHLNRRSSQSPWRPASFFAERARVRAF